jgi:hypothetical protein
MRNPVRNALRHHAARTVAATALASAVLTGGITAPGAHADTQLTSAEAAPATDPASAEPELPREASGRRAALMHRAVQRAKIAAVAQLRAKIVKLAKAQVGDSYRAGRTGPDAFDCSGLTSYVYKHAAGIDLPRVSYSQWRKVKRVRYGCDCYAYALAASGFVDLVVEAGLKPYDSCALVPVVEGAGGIMTDWAGKPLTIASDGRVCAAGDARVHAEALRVLA